MKRIGCVVFVLCISLWTGSALAQGTEKEAAAIAAAQKWLALIDAGQYDRGWHESAAYFKNAVSLDNWEQMLNATRRPLGALISRKVRSATHETSMPGAPDGEYVVIQFEASFANKKSAVETVTPMLEKHGDWRVSGYFMK